MDAKRRKLGAGKFERRPPRARRIEEDEEDEDEDRLEVEDPRFASDKDSSESEEGNEEESEDEENEEEEDDEDEDEDDEPEAESEAESEVEAPPSPQDLTFGQILKQQEKKAAKQKGKTGETADAKPAKDKDGRAAKDKDQGKARASRTSKHAPAEVTSRFAVKRGRDWLSGDATIAGVDVRPHEMRSRDPRFFLASMQGPASARDVERARRNYAFLDEYRDGEMEQLRQSLAGADKAVKAVRKSLAKAKGRGSDQMQERLAAAEQTADELRRQLTSMQARRKDRLAKQKEQEVLEAHKQRERELVRQGKKPFFLKRSEQKKQLLVDRFAGMTEQQADKAMERRRKKLASRERREMPVARRG